MEFSDTQLSSVHRERAATLSGPARDLNMKKHFVVMKVNTLDPPPLEKIDLFKLLNGKCMQSYVKNIICKYKLENPHFLFRLHWHLYFIIDIKLYSTLKIMAVLHFTDGVSFLSWGLQKITKRNLDATTSPKFPPRIRKIDTKIILGMFSSYSSQLSQLVNPETTDHQIIL